jgi:hypothetical protein
MNWIVCFAVFLTIAQAPVPAVGKATNNSTRNTQTQNQSTGTSKNPATPPVASHAKESDSTALKSESDNGTSSLDQISINITNPTTMPIPWGWKEWWIWGANLTLVAVGIGGIVVAVCTLKKIERQTKATEDATKIAKENMAALISKERARVRVEPPVNDLSFLVPGYRRKIKGELVPFTEEHTIEVSVFNRGGTAAHDVRASFGICIYPVSIEGENPIQNTDQVFIGDLVAGSDSSKHKIALYGGIQQEDLEAIHGQRSVLRVFGEVTYTDAFESQKLRTTTFSFEWKSDAEWHENRSIRDVSADSSGWYVYPPDANEAT